MKTKSDLNEVLVTCDAESEGVTVEELRLIGASQMPGEWRDVGDAVQGSIYQLSIDLPFDQFSERVDSFDSIFIRHLAPVEFEIELAGTEADLSALAELAPALAARMDSSLSFSVQSRVLGEGKLPYRKVVLNETLSMALEALTGSVMDCRRPQQVVSVLCTPTHALLGVSRVEQNRSAWSGGMQRLKREDGQVSRAEFKLLEALDVFVLTLPTEGRALDIGASPGGWTRLLAEGGLRVDAVDSGNLDPRLDGNPMIQHYRSRIQEYAVGSKKFAAIVNDMKMDARDSIHIMLGFSEVLEKDGVALMTLKMPKSGNSASASKKILDMLRLDLARLATAYQVVGARQLFHNRSEVTVALRSKKWDSVAGAE